MNLQIKKLKKIEVFYQIFDFYALVMCSKPIFSSKFARGC